MQMKVKLGSINYRGYLQVNFFLCELHHFKAFLQSSAN